MGRCLFLRLEEEYWRSPFLNQFLLEWNLKREMKIAKKFGVILLLNKRRVERKESGFCSYRCFRESEKLRCEKNSVSEQIFFFTCGILKHFFSIFCLRGLVLILFCFRLVLAVVWRFLVIYMNFFLLIRRFFMHFADFRAYFGFFDDYFVLLAQMSIEKTPSTWANFR